MSESHTIRLKSRRVSPARLTAFEILQRTEAGAYASVLLASREEALKSADRALCHELVMGVLRWQGWLDRVIEYYAGRSIGSLDSAVRIALRLGLYQLRFLSRIPAAAAVNEAVNLVRHARLGSAESFVNAILRRATREPTYDPSATVVDPVERLAIKTSHPRWLIERWTNAFGAMEAEAFASTNNEAAPIAFRVVTTRAIESEILAQLRAEGASVQSSAIVKGAWRVTAGGSLLRGLAQKGQIYIQDEASQLVAEVLEIQAGDRVLDVCSAPGSKTTQIAAANRKARVIAADVHEHRVRTVFNSSRLQGISGIQFLVLDAQQSLPFSARTFERVLVDAPCSGTGTLRHNPEIRWRISAGDIQELQHRQKQILNNASRMVRPSGRLIYSTCSVETEENEEVVSDFLNSNDSFVQVNLPVNSSLITESGAVRTWPHRDGADGFFIAAFEYKDR